MAEEWLKTYGHLTDAKVKVILPARLKTNFFDELISPCGMEAYISTADFIAYYSASTSTSAKTRIRSKFMAAITSKYEIMSFEKFKLLATQNKARLKQWMHEFTKNSMIIVDEVHNLLSDKYNKKVFFDLVDNGKFEKSGKGMSTILFKALNLFANPSPSTKMVYLTATPMFDNIKQIKELVN
jgi:hypothetical protein